MNQVRGLGIRFIPVALLMGAAALFVHGRGVGDSCHRAKTWLHFPTKSASGAERG